MLLSVSSLHSVYKLNANHNFKINNAISFKGNADEFISKPEVVFGNILNDEAQDIVGNVQSSKPLNSGWTSDVYNFNDKIVKVPKQKVFDNHYLETQAKGQNLKEYFALHKIAEISPDIATNPYGIIKNKDSYYLVEQVARGYHPNDSYLSSNVIKDLLSKFFSLDTNGIVNCDLQPGNIFIDNNKAKLIDFGSYNLIVNNGFVAGSDGIPFELFKPNGQIYNETNLDFPIRFMKTFLAPKFSDTKNLMDNPYINMPSNATNFELRTLYTHLLGNSEESPLEFFKGYLKLKVNEYHSKLKLFMQSLNPDVLNNYGINDEQINSVKAGLEDAIKYEDLLEKFLISGDKDIIELQLAKLQLRTYLNLGDSLNSPVENSKKLQSAYDRLISILKNGVSTSEGDKKEYFSRTLEFFEKSFEDYNFADGQVEIPEQEDLIKVLFKKIPQKIKDSVTQVQTQTSKAEQNIKITSNKKTIFPIVILGALLIGVGAFILKKIKFLSKAENVQKNLKLDNSSLNNNLSKNLAPTFSKFKEQTLPSK